MIEPLIDLIELLVINKYDINKRHTLIKDPR